MKICNPRVAIALAVVMATGTYPAMAQFVQKPAGPVKIYDTQADAKAEVAAAIQQARAEHKRVILDFGGNWCGDCIVLDRNFHSAENQALLDKYYVLVHVDIGHMDKNVDIADKYGVPLGKGVPALAGWSTRRRTASSRPCAAWIPRRSGNFWSSGSRCGRRRRAASSTAVRLTRYFCAGGAGTAPWGTSDGSGCPLAGAFPAGVGGLGGAGFGSASRLNSTLPVAAELSPT
jgi:thiol-disulfide isomerase/thioredoxin